MTWNFSVLIPGMYHYAAGILPITWVDGTLFFLIGKELRDGAFADFGGKCERGDRNDPLTTAVREFVEETYGMVVEFRSLRQRLNPSNCLMLKSTTQNGNPYYMYLVEIAYMPHLRNTFHKALAFLRHKNLHKMFVEKTDVKWVTLDALFSSDVLKRSVFAHTIDQHQHTLRSVASRKDTSPARPWRDVCTVHARVHGFQGLHGVTGDLEQDTYEPESYHYSRSPPQNSGSSAPSWRSAALPIAPNNGGSVIKVD